MTLISIRIIKVVLLGVFVYLTTLLTNFFLDRFNSPEWSVMLFVIIISTLILLFCLETIPDFFQRRFSKYKYYSKNELNRVDFDSFVMKSINEMNSDHEDESEVKIFRN